MIIAVDFDGTCVEHAFPKIGRDVDGCVETLRELRAESHEIIIWTIRSSETLEAARKWFRDREIDVLGVNANPMQRSWSSSPKAYAHLYIDDAALGCPLKRPGGDARAYVDWPAVRATLQSEGLLPPDNPKEIQ